MNKRSFEELLEAIKQARDGEFIAVDAEEMDALCSLVAHLRVFKNDDDKVECIIGESKEIREENTRLKEELAKAEHYIEYLQKRKSRKEQWMDRIMEILEYYEDSD